jgi:hypothetical protein
MTSTSIAAAGALMLAGALVACGGSSSSSSSSSSGGGVTDAAASPTDASQGDFCRTFTQPGSDVTPRQAATRMIAVGTPSGISGPAREGFVLLATRLFVLPDTSRRADFESVAKDLRGRDQTTVTAFVAYYANECSAVPSM